MNPRVLELIKNPKNIQSEDLGLLKEEIHAFPYIQNIRALHLYGVHLYEKKTIRKNFLSRRPIPQIKDSLPADQRKDQAGNQKGTCCGSPTFQNS